MQAFLPEVQECTRMQKKHTRAYLELCYDGHQVGSRVLSLVGCQAGFWNKNVKRLKYVRISYDVFFDIFFFFFFIKINMSWLLKMISYS